MVRKGLGRTGRSGRSRRNKGESGRDQGREKGRFRTEEDQKERPEVIRKRPRRTRQMSRMGPERSRGLEGAREGEGVTRRTKEGAREDQRRTWD